MSIHALNGIVKHKRKPQVVNIVKNDMLEIYDDLHVTVSWQLAACLMKQTNEQFHLF